MRTHTALIQNASDLIERFDELRPYPVIFAPEGVALTDEERAFFRAARPFGFILFQRNCQDKAQLQALIEDLRGCAGWHCPLLIDQEGGRVQRMKEPAWEALPSSRAVVDGLDESGAAEAVEGQARKLAAMLQEVGIDVNCMPVADVVIEDVTDNIIGDRAYGTDALHVARLSSAFIAESARLGMTSVIKHMPGHGQARIDSHKALPLVGTARAQLEEQDFLPFRYAQDEQQDAPLWGMVAHVVFRALDENMPASLSPVIIKDLLRRDLGYRNHLLLTDDINMGALAGFGIPAEIASISLAAGMDIILHCSGRLGEMKAVAADMPPMRDDTAQRVRLWLEQRAQALDANAQG